MAALKFIFILLFVIKNSQGFMDEIFTSADLDSYTMNFVNSIESKLKSNCVYDYPATRFQRRFAVTNTLKDMNKIMCEFKYNNATETFPWESIIEKFDYFEYSFELTNMMRKISNYWKALDKHSRVNDYEGSSLMIGWGPCDNVDGTFNWKSIVDAELCHGDVNAVYAQFISAIKNRMEKYASKINICEIKSTLKKEMVAFFQQGIKAHIQRFILTVFELSVKSQCRESCISNEIAGLKKQFMKTVHDYQELLMKTMAGFAQFIKKCDTPKPDPCDYTDPCGQPSPRAKSYNYIELERAYQTKIVNEKELSKSDSCSHNCDLSKISDINTNGECKKYQECKYISSRYDVCEANDKRRRYEWFKTDDGATYGNSNVCYGRTTSLSSLSDFWSFTFDSCNYCVCTCVAKPKHDEHVLTAISFREQVTDFHNEKVVVGVKFVKKDYMVHLQIAEAKLLPYGKIDQSSVAWKPLEDFDYNESEQKFYVKSGYGNVKPLSMGKDYGHPTAINLDDLMAPTDYIVTGVRFRYAGDSPDCPKFQEGAIELQIQIRRFDFAEGHISDNYKPRWVPAGKSNRCELVLEEPDNPLKSFENNQLSTPNQFVKFRPSDLRKDAGQSTVPFFDASEVKGSPLMPFKGIGLYHRGNKGSGGFLALRFYDFDSRSYTTATVRKNVPQSNSNSGFGGRMGFFQFLGNIAKFPFELTQDFFKNLRNMDAQ